MGEDCCDLKQKLTKQLQDEAKLGRLKFLFRHGLNEEGKLSRMIAMGGRGVSIFEMTDDFQAKLVWDSGDEIEVKHAEQDPEGELGFFNPDMVDSTDDTVQDAFDQRSDDKGVETESLDIGECGGESGTPCRLPERCVEAETRGGRAGACREQTYTAAQEKTGLCSEQIPFFPAQR